MSEDMKIKGLNSNTPIPLAEVGITDNNGDFSKRGLAAADIFLNTGASIQDKYDSGEWGGGSGSGGGDGGGPGQQIRTYGVQIDLNNSNPDTSVSYIGGAVGMVGGSPLWDTMPIFKDIRPCLFNNGQVVGYLNPNNYAQFENGSAADITSGNAGDVMIEIPRLGWRINTSGNIMTVEVTNDPNAGAQGFRYFAHSRGAEGDRNKLYVGAYKGFILNSRLRSLSGRTPNVSITIADLRTAAEANGAGYSQSMFYPVMLLQILYLIRFCNLNSRGALGTGASGGAASGLTGPLVTGGTNARGLNWGTQNAAEQVKCLGIEDLWGNVWERVEGCFIDANHNLLTAFQNFNDTGAGYTNRGATGATATISDWIRRVQGNSEMGFLIREGGGSETTFFSDWGSIVASHLGIFGGSWAITVSHVGVFHFRWFTAASVDSHVGGRLMFL